MKIDLIAQKANVSRATVSRVLNQSPKVKAKTRQAVEKVIREMNYIPNAAARSLATKRSGVIGVLIYDIIQPFWSSIFAGIEMELSPKGYGLLLANSKSHANAYDSSHDYRRNLRSLMSQNIDGLIIVLVDDLEQEDVDALEVANIPYVVVQSSLSDSRVSSVNIDNIKAAHDATEYLIKNGHKSIIHAAGPVGNVISNNRSNGFLETMKRYHLPIHEQSVVPCGFLFDEGYIFMKRIFGQLLKPTAILFSNDISAYGACQFAKEKGISIAEDISLMGIDRLANMMELSGFLPDLSTMIHPTKALGEQAAKLLKQKIKGDIERKTVMLSCNLYEGSTVKTQANPKGENT